ncbi:hypothetical protein WMY93_007726 [Mugilogobius chulae]|uniref:Uromodulin-like 1 n=1 Tax=Mugilogobius chulae TaxID=88201 RepID=A0AAW0PF53_9GOBI
MNYMFFIWLIWGLSNLCKGQLSEQKDYRLSQFGYHLCTHNETRLVSYTVQYMVPYTVTRQCGGWIPWKTCQVIKYRMTQYTEYKTVTEQVTRCCDGYIQVGHYCAPAIDRSRETTAKPGSCPTAVGLYNCKGCDWDIECPGWQKCCQFCTSPTSSSNSENGGSKFNATVTIKVDYHDLMSRGGGLYNHTRLLYAMVTGVLESNVSIYYLSSHPVHPYRTATSLMIDCKFSTTLNNITSVLYRLIQNIEEVSSVTVEDIDECLQPFLYHCSPNADCVNTIGSYFCTCRPGYTDVDPANTGTNCTAIPTFPPKITHFPLISTASTLLSTIGPQMNVSPSLNYTTEAQTVPYTNGTFQPSTTCSTSSIINLQASNVTATSFCVYWSSQFPGNQSYSVVLSKGSKVIYLNDTSQTMLEMRGLQAGALYDVMITPYACGEKETVHNSPLGQIYQSLSPEMKALVDSGQVRIEITGFSPGSVVVNFTLIFTLSQGNDIISNMSSAVLNSLKNSSKYDVDTNSTQIIDRDECTSKDNDCSPFATCTNTWGSYNCTCLEGFVDGNTERPGRSCQAPPTTTFTPPTTTITALATTSAPKVTTIIAALTTTTATPATIISALTTTTATPTTAAPQTTTATPTTAAPQTTTATPTTAAPQTTTATPTTAAPQTTTATPTTAAPQTTTATPTTAAPQTTTATPTSAAPQTTTATPTTAAPQTTTATPTTAAPQTTTATPTTAAPQTTTATPTTAAPQTTTATSTIIPLQITTISPTTTTTAPTTTITAPATTTISPTTTTNIPIPAAPQTTTIFPTTTTALTTTLASTSTTAAPATTTTAPTTTSAQTTTSTAPTSTSAPTTTTTTTTTARTTTTALTTTSTPPTTTITAPTTTSTAPTTTSTAPTTTSTAQTTTTTAPTTTTTSFKSTTDKSTISSTEDQTAVMTTNNPTASISASGAITVKCNLASITVTVARNFLQNNQITEAALYLGMVGCGVNGGNSTHVQLTVAWDECNTVLMHNDSYYTAFVTLFNSVNTVQVSNKVRLQIPVICSYMKSILITSDFSSMGYDIIKNIIEGSGMFQVSVQLMNGTVPLPYNYSLSPSEAVVLVVSLNTSVEKIKVVINRCWATATQSLTPISNVFMENRCSMNPYTTVITNGNSSTSSLSVQIFSFVDLSMIYLHCQVEICVEMTLGSCIPDCLQRTFRSGSANTVETAVSSYGPLLRLNDDSFEEGYDQISIIGLSCLGVALAIFFIIGFVCLFYYQRNRIGHYNFNNKPKEENFTYLTFSA